MVVTYEPKPELPINLREMEVVSCRETYGLLDILRNIQPLYGQEIQTGKL